MPYPVAKEHPESTPCVKKLRGSSVGVKEAAKNSVPRRRPPVENECHSSQAALSRRVPKLPALVVTLSLTLLVNVTSRSSIAGGFRKIAQSLCGAAGAGDGALMSAGIRVVHAVAVIIILLVPGIISLRNVT
jgi:hypothetical protein